MSDIELRGHLLHIEFERLIATPVVCHNVTMGGCVAIAAAELREGMFASASTVVLLDLPLGPATLLVRLAARDPQRPDTAVVAFFDKYSPSREYLETYLEHVANESLVGEQ